LPIEFMKLVTLFLDPKRTVSFHIPDQLANDGAAERHQKM
jgi:hypothetical protein